MKDWNVLIESQIDAVQVDAENKIAQVRFTAPWDGRPRQFVMAMSGVEELIIDSLRLTNIVEQILHYSGSEHELAPKLFKLMRGREASNDDLSWPPLIATLAKIKNGDLRFFEIVAIYGARASALVSDVLLDEVED